MGYPAYAAFANGRLLTFSGSRAVRPDEFRALAPYPRGGLLMLYTEASLDTGTDSRVRLLEARLMSERPQ